MNAIERINVELTSGMPSNSNAEFMAVCSVSFRIAEVGRYVVHGIKIVCKEGKYIISMPSARRFFLCHDCRRTTPTGGSYCCWCGNESRIIGQCEAQHSDSFHPLDQNSRMNLEAAILEAYFEKVKKLENSKAAV